MALINCYECGKEISDMAMTCPKCGAPQKQAGKFSDKGVVINGVKWATRNVDTPGTFAAKPEDSGMFYQWNRKKASPTTGIVTSWDYGHSIGNIWEKTNEPSPAGWHVPTLDEIKTLFNTDKVSNEWITKNGRNGRRFIDKATGDTLFLPAMGFRGYGDGNLYNVSQEGRYWCGTQSDNMACDLGFNSNGADWNCLGSFVRNFGFNVRSVAD